MKCSGYSANALYEYRYFMDRFKEVSELAELVPILVSEVIVLIDCEVLVVLVKYKGILKSDTTLNHKVSTILSDTAVSNP